MIVFKKKKNEKIFFTSNAADGVDGAVDSERTKHTA